MDRSRWKKSHVWLVKIALLAITGCAGPLATAIWVVKGSTLPAEYAGLKNKKVAVVVRAPETLSYRTRFAANDLASQITQQLKDNVRKIKLVPQPKIADWMDEHGWRDPIELGGALDAEVVVAIELEDFRLYDSQTLYRGRAIALVRVWDVEKEEVLFEKRPPQIVYPSRAGVAISERQEYEFRNAFVKVLAYELAKLFYDYDKTAGFASDNLAYK